MCPHISEYIHLIVEFIFKTYRPESQYWKNIYKNNWIQDYIKNKRQRPESEQLKNIYRNNWIQDYIKNIRQRPESQYWNFVIFRIIFKKNTYLSLKDHVGCPLKKIPRYGTHFLGSSKTSSNTKFQRKYFLDKK